MADVTKKSDISKWPIPACLFMGIGIGLLLGEKIRTALPGFTIFGLGLGILITFIFSREK